MAFSKLIPYLFQPPPNYVSRIIRGTRVISIHQADRIVRRMIQPGEHVVRWAGLPLPDHMCANHLLLCGGTGSGKTVMLRLLLQSLVDRVIPGSDTRILLYDPKCEMMSLLDGMDCQCPIDLHQAFDTRSVGMDFSNVIDSLASALQMSRILISTDDSADNSPNAFFYHAARDLLAAVLQAFVITKPHNWTLAEVMLTLSSRERTEALLRSCPQTRAQADEHFNDSEALTNVFYTITAYVSMLRPILSLYTKASEQITLKEWINQESILILGTAQELRAPQQAINSVVIERMSDLLLAQGESDTRQTWIIIDETRELSYCKKAISRLLDMGRSKGVRIVIVIQTIEGFRATFGKYADEIANMCGNKAFLQNDSQLTAEWAAKTIGDAEYQIWSQSRDRKSRDNPSSISERIHNHQAVLPSEIMRMHRANRRRFYGYFVSPSVGCFGGKVKFSRILAERGNVADFIPRPPEDQYFSEESVSHSPTRRTATPLEDITRAGILATARKYYKGK